jgi:hypothetical protein
MSIVLGQRITSLTVLMPWQMVLVTMEKMLESYVKILSFLQVRKIDSGRGHTVCYGHNVGGQPRFGGGGFSLLGDHLHEL